ncbi:MAG TPA: DUF3822 family protein [Pedobacter sp.]|jgi:hypothetical protein
MNEFGILHLKDDRFDTARSREMQLLVRVAPKRISYAIINEKENRLLVLYDSPTSVNIEDTLYDLTTEYEYLRSTFSRIKVSVQTTGFTLIPIQYYTINDLEAYEQVLHAHEETKTFINAVFHGSVNCVSALEMATIAPLIGAFAEVKLLSQAEPLIEGSSKLDGINTHKLVLQFNEESFEAFLGTADKLLFYNLFAIENADDFNYFLLNVLQQFDVEPAEISVTLCGYIDSGDANYRRIEKYFSDIQFADSTILTTFSPAFEQLPKHQYYSLLSLILCE